MRILLLAPHPYFQDRGTPIAVRELLLVLSKRGDRVDVLTYHEGESPQIPNCEIHRITALPGLRNVRPGPSVKKLICDALLLLACLKMARRGRYDMVHAVEESAFFALAVKRLYRIPFVYDMDSSLAQQLVDKYAILRAIKGFMEGCERSAVRASVGVIAVCRSLEELAHRYDPGKRVLRLEDISLLDGNDNTHAVNPPLDRRRITGSVVMYVGNLERYQGIDLLLEGFRLALQEEPNTGLVIVGGGDQEIAHYRERCNELDIGSSVTFLGARPIAELASYLNQADILVSPRIQGENTPMKVYSYLDSGKPLLATRLPTHTQVLDDDIACLVAPEPTDFGSGLVRLIRNPTLARQLAAGARERVAKEYSRDAFRRKVEGFYEMLERDLNRGTNPPGVGDP